MNTKDNHIDPWEELGRKIFDKYQPKSVQAPKDFHDRVLQRIQSIESKKIEPIKATKVFWWMIAVGVLATIGALLFPQNDNTYNGIPTLRAYLPEWKLNFDFNISNVTLYALAAFMVLFVFQIGLLSRKLNQRYQQFSL